MAMNDAELAAHLAEIAGRLLIEVRASGVLSLKSLGRDDHTFSAGLLKTRIDYFLVSKEWAVLDGAVVDSDASDHKPIWVELGK